MWRMLGFHGAAGAQLLGSSEFAFQASYSFLQLNALDIHAMHGVLVKKY